MAKRTGRRAFLLQTAAISALAQPEPHAGLRARLELPRRPLRLVLDTDAANEIDDPFAIAYALRAPELHVEAVYSGTFVNKNAATPAEGQQQSYDEILRTLRKMDYQASPGFVLRGADRYLTGAPTPLENPAVDDLIRRAMEPREEPLWVVSLGCPTNVSAAIAREPRIVDRIVAAWIGGSPHGADSAADYNIQQDYEASRLLFDSGVALFEMPGYWVSEQMRTTRDELKRFLQGRSGIAQYLYELYLGYEHARRDGEADAYSKPIWDLAMIGWLVNSDWVRSKITPAPVLTPRMTWALDRSRHPMRVALHVDRDAIFTDFFSRVAQ